MSKTAEAATIYDISGDDSNDGDKDIPLDVESPSDVIGAPELDDIVVSIGEETPPQEEEKQAPEWVKELRKTQRELTRENRELKEKLAASSVTETNPVTLSKKPSLEAFDYDTDKYEEELAKWYDQKRVVEAANVTAEAELKAQQQAWQAKLDSYNSAKAELKVKDYDDAESTTLALLNVTQQGIILQGSDNPALVVYALGKNPKKAHDLASTTDPVKFAFAVAKLESQLKVTTRKTAPLPEKVLSGTGRISGSVDSTLDRLRAEAEKTGDYTKVAAYKRQKRTAT